MENRIPTSPLRVSRARQTLAASLLFLLSLLASGVAYADPGKVAEILRSKGSHGLAQNANLNDAAKAQIDAATKAAADATGHKVFVVVLHNGTPPGPYADLYTTLQMSGKDILLATNGVQWDLRSAALQSEARTGILAKTAAGSGDPIQRVENVLRETTSVLAQVKVGQTGTIATVGAKEVPLARKESSNVGLFGFLAVAAIGIGVWVFFRRKKRDQVIAAELHQALKGPEAVLTDIYLGMDGMENHPQFGALIEQANGVQARLDAIKSAPPSRESIAKLRSIHDDANRVRRAFDDARMLR